MKKVTKIVLISILSLGVLTPTVYFSTTKIMHDNKIKNGKNTLIQNLSNNDSFLIKSMNIKYANTALSHTFEFELEDVHFNVLSDTQLDMKADINIKYDYNPIFKGDFVLEDDIFYISPTESNIISSNVQFHFDDIKSMLSAYAESSLSSGQQFDFDLDFSFIEQLKENLIEIPTLDESVKTFSYPLDDYNSSILFISDNDYNLKKVKTSSAMQKLNQLITFTATNISVLDNYEIEVPKDVNYQNINPMFTGFESIFEKFDKKKGKGISLQLGDVANNKPVIITNASVSLFDLLGQLDVYHNPKNTKDIVLRYRGRLKPFGATITVPIDIDIIYEKGIFYFAADTKLIPVPKGSIRLGTIEEVFEINKKDLLISIDNLFFNILDTIGINSMLDKDYLLVKELNATDDLINSTLVLPISKEEEINKNPVFTFEIKYKDSKFDTLKFGDFQNNSIGFKDLQFKVNNELEPRPTIKPSEYKEFDDAFKKIFGK